MRRSTYRRASTNRFLGNRRLIAALATLVAFGGIVTVTQVSNADTRRPRGQRPAACAPSNPATSAPAEGGTAAPGDQNGGQRDGQNGGQRDGQNGGQANPTTPPTSGTYTDRNGVTFHVGDGQEGATTRRDRTGQNCASTTGTGGNQHGVNQGGQQPQPNDLEILGNNCNNSRLQEHDGFQNGNRCVDTAFGEVGSEDRNPTLLITRSPQRVRVNTAFDLQISTRNLVRDRFLAAAQGGYYKESSFLNGQGLVRGHFHTACRMLNSTRSAPNPAPVPAFFVATEDGRGGARPDVITVRVPGLPQTGIAQCASWAGDGSHRVPMMQRANQVPAFDAVRIQVTR